jgi:hypothetical protein
MRSAVAADGRDPGEASRPAAPQVLQGAFTAGEAFDARDFLTSLSPEPLSLGLR